MKEPAVAGVLGLAQVSPSLNLVPPEAEAKAEAHHADAAGAPFFPVWGARAQIPVKGLAAEGAGLHDTAVLDLDRAAQLVLVIETISDDRVEADLGEGVAEFFFAIPRVAEIRLPVVGKQGSHTNPPGLEKSHSALFSSQAVSAE
ncbi:hypothetical protein [Rhodoblastus sp.]|uniref:hypothetical protein n=1 Tax=Rhodoblastus sp. TaxID=1962975 RepID=UPI003F959EF0